MYWLVQFSRCFRLVPAYVAALLLIGCGVSSTNSGTAARTSAGTEHSVALMWNPVPSSIEGYNVYRGIESGGPYLRIASLVPSNSYKDNWVSSGQRYYYVITAVALNSAESGYSNEAVVFVPENPTN
jgi:fibronectin type 3 domain-containing protein